MKKLTALIALLLLALPVLAADSGVRTNHNRHYGFTASDTILVRDQAGLDYSSMSNDYVSAPGYCVIYTDYDYTSELPYSVALNGSAMLTDGGPDYEGDDTTHTPCSGYDYLPDVNASSMDSNAYQMQNVFVQIGAARQAAEYIDNYFPMTRNDHLIAWLFSNRTEFLRHVDICDRGDGYYSGDLAASSGGTCDRNSDCPTNEHCFQHGFNGTGGTGGRCAEEDGVGTSAFYSVADAVPPAGCDSDWTEQPQIIAWHDGFAEQIGGGDPDTSDGNPDLAPFTWHHEYGHHVINMMHSGSGGDPSQSECSTSSSGMKNSHAAESLAESFGRLSFARHLHGDGGYPAFTDRYDESENGYFSRESTGETRSTSTACGGGAHITARAFADAIWEMVYSVDCVTDTDCTNPTEVAAADDMGWGGTNPSSLDLVGRGDVLLRALGYAMDRFPSYHGSYLNAHDVAYDVLQELDDIKGSTFCENAEDIFHNHGLSGAVCP